MKRIAGFSLLPLLLILLGGCSVFGVATKGDLDDIAEQEALARQQMHQRIGALNDKLADIGQDLAEIERRLEPRLTSLETEVQGLDQDVAANQQKILDMELGMRGDLDRVRDDMQVVTGDMQQVRVGMVEVSSQARRASSISEQMFQAEYDEMIEERARLVDQLEDLDARIQNWRLQIESPVQQPLVPERPNELSQQRDGR
jgi:hypothetical protein